MAKRDGLGGGLLRHAHPCLDLAGVAQVAGQLPERFDDGGSAGMQVLPPGQRDVVVDRLHGQDVPEAHQLGLLNEHPAGQRLVQPGQRASSRSWPWWGRTSRSWPTPPPSPSRQR
ncbi:hypothetical protein [Nonomuraea sp. NPDC049709]|uniref:hypothetical protein n=1 Tax=Nonomuraea sp. NPDC049709 TaxID=3154736 RepID=UPI003426A7D0